MSGNIYLYVWNYIIFLFSLPSRGHFSLENEEQSQSIWKRVLELQLFQYTQLNWRINFFFKDKWLRSSGSNSSIGTLTPSSLLCRLESTFSFKKMTINLSCLIQSKSVNTYTYLSLPNSFWVILMALNNFIKLRFELYFWLVDCHNFPLGDYFANLYRVCSSNSYDH